MKYLWLLVLSFYVNAGDIYVSNNGSNSSSGSVHEPLLSLSHAVSIASEGDAIHVESGNYYCETVVVDKPLTIKGSSNRPVFYGCGQDVFLRITSDDVNVSYLKTVDYKTSVRYYGDRDISEINIDGGSLYGMYFQDGYGSSGFVVMVNSDNISIKNSHFINGNNSASFHGVYLAHGSSHNYIKGNRFIGISGDPIRVRDLSNYNYINANYFQDSGYYATFSDWYCTENCTKEERECRSYGNEFRSNNVDFKIFAKWGSDTVCGPLPDAWLKTSGNY